MLADIFAASMSTPLRRLPSRCGLAKRARASFFPQAISVLVMSVSASFKSQPLEVTTVKTPTLSSSPDSALFVQHVRRLAGRASLRFRHDGALINDRVVTLFFSVQFSLQVRTMDVLARRGHRVGCCTDSRGRYWRAMLVYEPVSSSKLCVDAYPPFF